MVFYKTQFLNKKNSEKVGQSKFHVDVPGHKFDNKKIYQKTFLNSFTM